MTQPPLPEWAPHEAVWIGFPSDPELWLGDLKPAEREVAAFAGAVHAGGKGEQVWLVAAHEGAAESARELCPFAQVIVELFGDIWLRDTGPIVVGSGKDRRAQGFGFNGWGGKYDLDGDQDVGERLAKRSGLPFAKAGWVLEGGAIDGDGSGTVVTTEQGGLSRCRPAASVDQARHRQPALARTSAGRGRGDHPGELHELLHRQCGGGGSAIWSAQRQGRSERGPGALPRPRCNRASRRP